MLGLRKIIALNQSLTMNIRNAYNGTARRQDPSALAAVIICGVTDCGNTLCVCSKAMEATA